MKKSSRRKSRKKLSLPRRIWRFTYRAFVVLWLLSILSVVALKYVPVCVTPLMVRRTFEALFDGRTPRNEKQWRPLSAIAPSLAVAAVASEDNLFLDHNGFSASAIRKSLAAHLEGRRLRGGSTISQQTAKNVFTFGSRTWFRKGVEAYFTVLIEFVWGKERIMEVYLNVVELGDGIYGAEAASLHYFGVPASRLSRSQSALMVAALPSPLHYSIVRPGPYMRRRQQQILDLMPKMKRIGFLYDDEE